MSKKSMEQFKSQGTYRTINNCHKQHVIKKHLFNGS